MRRYFCPHCANEVHFDNTLCVKCNSNLAYSTAADEFQSSAPHLESASSNDRYCANRNLIHCNWIVKRNEPSPFCISCRHTLVIPDLSTPPNVDRWARLESAKRMLFYSLQKFHLPVGGQKDELNRELRFEFKSDLIPAVGQETRVFTGHHAGVITINVMEADDDVREQHRVAMGEPYRTLIGHFRHEIGHFYWDQLVSQAGKLDAFRATFGNERLAYAEALERHYQSGPPLGWENFFVSSYASSHPWEDFAETWAHYFHIIDGLETAQSYAVASSSNKSDMTPYETRSIDELINAWVPLTIAMNAMNRSIGNSDFYPFVLSETITGKLQFIHNLIHNV